MNSNKMQEDSNPNCGGAREKVVQAYLGDPPSWKERVGYGQRWSSFFRVKRLFGKGGPGCEVCAEW
jgi:hypothetical protein